MTTARIRPRALFPAIAAIILIALVDCAHADCTRSCATALAACKRTRCAGLHARDRKRCLADCRGGSGCGGGFGTLAYVVSTCRVQEDRQIATQELRIRRNGCESVTVIRFATPEPVPDPFGLCTLLSKNHSGHLSPIAGVFQRLGVSGDGGSVVFEISNQFQLVGRTDLTPEQQGFFWVRTDGTGLRRLAPPSRDAVYRLVPNTPGTTDDGGFGVFPSIATKLAINKEGSRIAYSDLGPGTSGREAEQIFTLDVATGTRRQVTHFDPEPRAAGNPAHPLLWLAFYFPDTVGFEHPRPSGWESWLVDFDGSNTRPFPGAPLELPAGGTGPVQPRIGVISRRVELFTAGVPGTTENSDIFSGFGIFEIFRRAGTNVIQLTKFHRIDTAILGATRKGVVFHASGDPLGTNPFQSCQLFRMSLLGLHLQQLTRLGTGERSQEGCGLFGPTPGCTLRPVAQDWPAVRSRCLLFYSDCDPFGANPDGSQVFAVDRDGSHLRQLTDTAGTRTVDGALEVEIPGPTATEERWH